MGTAGQWLRVLIYGGIYGGVMAWWLAKSSKTPAMLKPKGRVERIEYAVTWALMGLIYGIVTTFHWQRATHRPLVFVTLIALTGVLLISWVARKRRKSTIDASS